MATITGTQDRQEQQQEQARPGRARTRTVKYLIALTPGERALLAWNKRRCHQVQGMLIDRHARSSEEGMTSAGFYQESALRGDKGWSILALQRVHDRCKASRATSSATTGTLINTLSDHL